MGEKWNDDLNILNQLGNLIYHDQVER